MSIRIYYSVFQDPSVLSFTCRRNFNTDELLVNLKIVQPIIVKLDMIVEQFYLSFYDIYDRDLKSWSKVKFQGQSGFRLNMGPYLISYLTHSLCTWYQG